MKANRFRKSMLAFTLAVSATLALTSHGLAQLSGNYTINPAIATGGRNFKSFTAAMSALGQQGVSAPVVFVVVSGTITESWTLPKFQGGSTTNTVTFRSMVPGFLKLSKLHGGASDIVTIQPGVSNVIFDGLVFEKATQGGAIFGTTGSSPNQQNIVNVTVRNCFFENGLAGHMLNNRPGYGVIYFTGSGSPVNWLIHDNQFNLGPLQYGLYLSLFRNSQIYRNKFDLQGTVRGLYFINYNNSQNQIYNNIFTGRTSSSTSAVVVHMAASNSNNDFTHNTIAVNTPGWALQTFGHANNNYNRIYSNIFAITGAGGGIAMTIGTTALHHFQSDGNLFFIQSKKIGRILTTNYTSLTAWQNATAALPRGAADKNSVVGDPKFVSATDLHLQTTSPAIGKGRAFAGRFLAQEDFDGYRRGTKQDCGAYEVAAWISYDSGCPGAGNKTPVLSVGGNIGVGDQASIDVSNARANSRAALAIGLSKTAISLGGSCTLLNQPLILLFVQTDGSGKHSLPVAVPTSATLTGVKAYVQYGIADPAAAGGIATTQGGTIRF
ncbi:MAG: hypothetical protein ACYTGW_21755 [Planctomycetota bacterium]|jgi:hypothetical protein